MSTSLRANDMSLGHMCVHRWINLKFQLWNFPDGGSSATRAKSTINWKSCRLLPRRKALHVCSIYVTLSNANCFPESTSTPTLSRCQKRCCNLLPFCQKWFPHLHLINHNCASPWLRTLIRLRSLINELKFILLAGSVIEWRVLDGKSKCD